MSRLGEAGKDALAGAAAGSVAGPWGTAIGGAGGALYGFLTGGDDAEAPDYTPNRLNFQYGLGRSGSYASQQSDIYGRRQRELADLALDAHNRSAPTQAVPDQISQVQSGGQGYLQNADRESRAQQLAALGGLQNQTGALNAFANRAPGPSAAQAQLQAGADMAARQQFGFARAQPGGGGAALRQAAFNAAGISGGAANEAAMLRAQEDQSYRAQQLQALGAAQQGAGMSAGYAGQIRQGDQGFAGAQAGQANYDAGAANQFNQGQQQLQYQVGANNLQAAGQARGQNDAMTLGTYGLSQGYDAQRNSVAAANSAQGNNYEAARAQGAGLGAQNFNAATQQGNVERGQTLGLLSSALGAYGQMSGGSGGGGAVDANGNKMMMSDVRAKKNIEPASVLEALGGKRAPAQTRMAPDSRAQLAALGGAPLPQPDTAALDEAYRRQGGEPNLRPAQGYEYSYKDPAANGAGRYIGPMAQDLEHLPGVVEQGPDGQKAINAPRLTLANTAAVSELQRKQDELDRRLQLQALGAAHLQPSGFARPDLQPPDYAALGAPGYHY